MRRNVLKAYRTKYHLSRKAFAKQCGVSKVGYLDLIDYGLRFPGYNNLLRLYRGSHGEITANDFVDYASVDLDTPINDTNEPESNNDH